jgi:DNA-binding CsgD family transcriptional regulator
MISIQHALRPLAVRRDAEAGAVFELRILWEQLRRGAWVFCDTFSTPERCYAVLRSVRDPRPLHPRKLRLLEAILLGTPAKVVALDNCRSLSCVTTASHECLRAMGLDCKASQASVLLPMAATALLRSELANQQGRYSALEAEEGEYAIVSALRPDLQFPVELSLAEAAVVRGLVDGHSYAQISGARARSQRTVANQLATAFRKLGVSGRRATIERLIVHSAQLG